jgi:regulatory protein
LPVRQAKAPRTLRQRAIALLARRDYARAELAARLARGGADPGEVEATLDELQHAGYLCDARFASSVVRQKASSFSKRAIVHALKEKGVGREAADQAMAQLQDVDELAAATALWQRRFGSPPADERDKARQVRFLLSRGYSHGIAFRVLREAGAVAASDADEG